MKAQIDGDVCAQPRVKVMKKIWWMLFLVLYLNILTGTHAEDNQVTTQNEPLGYKPTEHPNHVVISPQQATFPSETSPQSASLRTTLTQITSSSTTDKPATSELLLQAPVILLPLDNLTVSIGDDVLLKCAVENNPPDPGQKITITWFKENVVIKQNTFPRITFPQARRKLKITQVQWEDRGNYFCTARNRYGVVRSTPGRLEVEKAVSIIMGIQNMTVPKDTPINSTCIVEGYPKPLIHWELNGVVYRDVSTNSPYDKQFIEFIAQNTVKLTCKAVNTITTVGETRKQSSGFIFVTNPASYCKSYNGFNCAPFGLGEVFVNASLDNPPGKLERMVSEVVDSTNAMTIPKRCKNAFNSLLCHLVFPDCEKSGPPPRPVRLCQEDCIAIKDLVCLNHWKELQTIHSPLFEPYLSLGFPECTAFDSDSRDTCTRTGYFDAPKSLKTTAKCTIHSGKGYRGQVNKTENGRYCQKWNSEVFLSAGFYPQVFPELLNANNYCRNPGGLEDRPWCFVRMNANEKQFCNIPSCDSLPEGTTVVPSTNRRLYIHYISDEEDFHDDNVPKKGEGIITTISASAFFFIICAAVFILLVMTIVIVLSYRRVKYLKRYPPYTFPRGFDIRLVPDNPMFGKNFNRSYNPLLESLEYPRNEIVYLADIGEGAFGRVFKATAVDSSTPDEKIIVAVKVLKSSASSIVTENFNREACMMSEFSNINVIKLWGVCFVGKPLCILLEYMDKGDLQEFLQLKNPRNPQFFDTEVSETGLPLKHQVSFARQVANGMVYLSDRRLVHRDIATRNCLVNALMQVKISDFGLARYLGQEDYYVGSKNEKVPIRWTAPEALWHYKFTTYSDVWSYGVLTWEIFSYAEQPYTGMTLEQVFLETQQGHQLPCPEDTPVAMYNIMKSCWSLNEMSRPSFQTLNSHLSDLETGIHRQQRLSSSSC